MSLPVVWLPVAADELREAVRRYVSIRPELGVRFAQAVDDAVADIARAPLLFAVIAKERRRVGVKRFPYSLYFLVEERRLVVLACFHGKRDPNQWQRRETTG